MHSRGAIVSLTQTWVAQGKEIGQVAQSLYPDGRIVVLRPEDESL